MAKLSNLPDGSQICQNCGAKCKDEFVGEMDGKIICCVHCAFNPLGCRCKYGEYGVAEEFIYDDMDQV